jgi:hypothetical protein
MTVKHLGRFKSTDAYGTGPIPRSGATRDQDDPEPGALVCKLSQNGETGQWSGTDCDGRPLVITRAGDGTFEIRHAGGNGDVVAANNTAKLGMTSPRDRPCPAIVGESP